ncbi:vitamin B12-binding protein precursor [Jeotgalibacillus soli]|uniref:Vitamin B12-binding protein n=2 Tax=Jeotgalibacillus soli TaxID=889306 RepID=A0A0C2V0M0_9BACL|nr:vitamin B12-binding protein precursor [Jeotgalibacillus soli]
MDLLESLSPDLVLASLSVPGMEKNIEALIERNIPHIVLNPQSLDEIGTDLLTAGKAVNKEKHAQNVYQTYLDTLALFKHTVEKIPVTPSLYWEWWPKPVFTPGAINWLTEVSELAGGKNIFEGVELASVQTDWDDILQRQPDHICLAWVGVRIEKVQPDIVKKRPGWNRLDAVLQNRIHVLEESLYCRPSPRLLQGILQLGNILHSSAYRHIELPALFRT